VRAFGGLTWKIFLGNASLVVLALVVSALLIASEVSRLRNQDHRRDLATEATLLANLLEGAGANAPAIARQQAAQLADSGRSVFLVDPSGAKAIAVAPHFNVPDEMLTPSQQATALREGIAHASTRSARDGRAMIAVGVRVGTPDKPIGLVLIARPTWSFASDWAMFGRLSVQLVLVAAVATTLLAVGLARLWARPLQQVIHTARSLSRGDLSARAEQSGNDELALLARALNRMRDRLMRNYQTIDRQRRTLELLLKQLREGVIVADATGRVVLINPAALRLLNLPHQDPDGLVGKAIERCVAQHDLQRMLHQPRGHNTAEGPNGDPTLLESRVQIEGPQGTRYLLAHASDLMLLDGQREEAATSTGRLLVLTDVTVLTRAVEIKTDFVANASHELRTPLSTIRAAVETLQRMDLAGDAAAATRFVDVIDRQSLRLEALASDLLELARLESADQRLQASELSIDRLLSEVRQTFADRLAAKNIEWRDNRGSGSRDNILVNPHLLQLILDNLVDNAVKFTEPGGFVRVVCQTNPDSVTFIVEDNGCGIPEEDRKRVFERFYQVERARSGQTRGTGLGLAIVRHAVAALGGDIELSSETGRGTRITVRIPQPRGAEVEPEQGDAGRAPRV